MNYSRNVFLGTSLVLSQLLLLTPMALGQSETCTNPAVVSGTGVFPFDTTGFQDSVFDEQTNCDIQFGPGENLNGDGFFTWVAPATGDYQFVAEGRNANGIDWDIQMAIYDGSDCNATCIANDRSSGPNRAALIGLLGLNAGQPLLIQVGGYDFFNDGNPTTYQGLGTLTIEPRPIACQNNTDDGFENNDTCSAATPIVPGVHSDLFFSIEDPDFYSITIQPGDSLRVDLLSSDIPLFFYLYDTSCNLMGIQFTNWIRTNQSSVPETIIIQPVRSSVAPAIPCSHYDLELTLAQNLCAGEIDDAFEDNDFSNTPASIGDGYHPDLLITFGPNTSGVAEVDYFVMPVPAGATVRCDVRFDDAQANIDAYFLNQNGSFLDLANSTTDHESLEWTNNTGAIFDVKLLVFIAATGTQTCNRYDLIISGLDSGVGIPFCDANNNSTGLPTFLTGQFDSGVGSGLHLEALQGPPNQFGYLLAGNQNASPGVPVSAGQLCLIGTPGTAFYRYNLVGTTSNSIGQFDAAGVLQNLAGTSTLGSGFDVPNSIPTVGPIMNGSTWHFQFWHRDNSAGQGVSNLSNGLSVTFP